MKQFILIFFLCLSTPFCFCQDETDMFSIDLLYGKQLYLNNFYSQLNTIERYSSKMPVQTIGIGLSGSYVRNKRHPIATHYTYSKVVPQKIQLSDTISCIINGNSFSANFGYDFFQKSKIANLLFTFGYSFGKLKLTSENWKWKKNGFFSPNISLQPKIKIKLLSLSLRVDYNFDTSHTYWKAKYKINQEKYILETFRQSGISVFICIGLAAF